MSRRRVLVLGGGMAGMTAAWRLSSPELTDRVESVTVLQRGWRLGGKGASSRGVNGRIEEHGLHVWLGYYENAFRVLRDVYGALDRPTTDPECPIRTWEDALRPSTEVGLEDIRGSGWRHWIGDFATNELVPGDGVATAPMSPVEFVRRGIDLLADFFGSLAADAAGPAGRGDAAWIAARGALGVLLEAVRVGRELVGGVAAPLAATPITNALDALHGALRERASDDPDIRQTWELVSVVVATIRGLVADGALQDPQAFRVLNAWDYREWIAHHGASQEAVDSTLVRGLYDLVFGYANGDTRRPGFGAGLGVFLSGKTFFDYKGAIFWKMQAGMGDIVFAPMYEVMARRGVRFEFFTNVEDLRLDPGAGSISEVVVGRQARPLVEGGTYDPLVRVGALPVFPDRPLTDRLQPGGAGPTSESWWARDEVVGREVLRAGIDFDVVVFALPVGMARQVTGELMRVSPPWRNMVDGLGVVGTQALQVWLRRSESALGWDRPGVTISGFVKPFDTWASMPQLREVEQWPDHDRAEALEYFCATLPTPAELPGRSDYPTERHREVRENARRFLERHVAHYLPGVSRDGEFDWALLCGDDSIEGGDRLDEQYWRANVDPSDLYVQSLPGTDRLRLRADQSGFDNMVLAGDWTDNGVNAGCIEAATLSGLQAANAVVGRPLLDGVVGTYLPLNER